MDCKCVFLVIFPLVFVQLCELQRCLKASQAEQQEALERSAAAVTMEQKAKQDSLLQVHLYTRTHTHTHTDTG